MIVGILRIVKNISGDKIVFALATILWPDFAKIDLDAGAKISSGFFNERQQILASILAIAVGVAGHNHLAMALDQFVNRQVLEMSTVGKINVALVLVALGHQFRK